MKVEDIRQRIADSPVTGYIYVDRSRLWRFGSDWYHVFRWMSRKFLKLPVYEPGVLPPPLKRALLRNFARKYHIKTFVETGTWLGDAVQSLSKVCPRVFSVEIQPLLYEKAKQRFKGRKGIDILKGDTKDVLPEILAGLHDEAALFWLDAHYSSQSVGTDNCPTFSELRCILEHPILNHVICIDDMRGFIAQNVGFPTVAEVTNLVKSLRPDLRVTVKNDIMRIEPN